MRESSSDLLFTLLRSNISTGMPLERAIAMACASGLFVISTAICASHLPAAMSSAIALKLLPRPEARTATSIPMVIWGWKVFLFSYAISGHGFRKIRHPGFHGRADRGPHREPPQGDHDRLRRAAGKGQARQFRPPGKRLQPQDLGKKDNQGQRSRGGDILPEGARGPQAGMQRHVFAAGSVLQMRRGGSAAPLLPDAALDLAGNRPGLQV